MGCNCKNKYKNNNLDNLELVKGAIELYTQSLLGEEDNTFEDNWNILYANFILIYPRTKIHTKEFINSEYQKLVKSYGR